VDQGLSADLVRTIAILPNVHSPGFDQSLIPTCLVRCSDENVPKTRTADSASPVYLIGGTVPICPAHVRVSRRQNSRSKALVLRLTSRISHSIYSQDGTSELCTDWNLHFCRNKITVNTSSPPFTLVTLPHVWPASCQCLSREQRRASRIECSVRCEIVSRAAKKAF
jgi:hypothetical protein